MNKELPWIVKFFRHLHTVRTHRFVVMKNCFKCGLYRQGLLHDLSKYSPSEFGVSVRYFQGDRSPYMKEKELHGYSLGWLHHKGRNKHHWEYWYDMVDGKWIPLEMPYPYVVEMACDRVAACKIYQKEAYTKASALEYYMTRNDRLFMHPKTARLLESILQDISIQGEDTVFKELRKNLREHRG